MGDDSRQTVLVVEDDEDLRCWLERELTEFGLAITAVPSAEAAIDVLNEPGERVAVTVTDIKMPGMDGVELTRWIKRCCPEVEVILLTGHGSIESAVAAVRLGASDYLMKPLQDISELHDSVQSAIAKRTRSHGHTEAGPAAPAVERTLFTLLEQLPLGVVLLDGVGRIVRANRRAQATLAEGDGLEIGTDGRLYAACALDTRKLRDLLAPPSRSPRRVAAVSLQRPSGRSPLSLLVAASDPTADAPSTGLPGVVTSAVFIGDPDQRGPSAAWLLRELHGLTRAEARLTQSLLEGHSIESAAAVLGISRNTARTHLKRVFSKTGTCRQADLVSLLLQSPALLQLDGDGDAPDGSEAGMLRIAEADRTPGGRP